MNFLTSSSWFLAAAIWYSANGVLHDIFVLIRHKGPYNRDLLRLLMDGHVLLLSGVVCFVCWQMQRHGVPYAGILGCGIAVFMLLYCFMIMPFLKSFVTLLISLTLLAASVRAMNPA